MPIRTEDVKIKESQRLTDHNDGGGYMTGREVIDGAINNMFTDISRLDRAYGRVSLRKFYLHVDTEDTDMLSGTHMIISDPAKDPMVNVALFTTEKDSDTRQLAVSRLESYVTLGPRSMFWLWSDQPAGARQLLLFCDPAVQNPEAGEVYCIFNNKNTASEYSQYVRVTKCEEHPEKIEGRKILTVSISDPLEVTFKGTEIHSDNAQPTSFYTTIVSDAAKYYGVMRLRDEVKESDINLKVESIYTQLVPTSQAETPLLNLSPGIAGPISKCGNTYSINFPSQQWQNINLGQAFVPGTLKLEIAGMLYEDDGSGILQFTGNQVGVIHYAIGHIWLKTPTTGELKASYDPGVELNIVPATLMIPVEAASRGYNYVGIMWPRPVPGTVMADYMAEGKWYRLYDNGDGILEPLVENTGTGRIDYATGQCSITTAALPDVDVPILLAWGTATETHQLQGAVEIEMEPVHHVLANAPVAPKTVTITWPVGINGTATATDDGEGYFTGDATGWVNYGTGELEFFPKKLPVNGSKYTVHHDKYTPQVWVGGGTGNVLTIPNAPIKPGTLCIDMPMSIAGWTHTYRFMDTGTGVIGADGFSQCISQSRGCTESASQSMNSSRGSGGGTSSSTSGKQVTTSTSSGTSSGSGSSSSYNLDTNESNTTAAAGYIKATVDYTSGKVVFDLTTATGWSSTISSSASKSGSKTSNISSSSSSGSSTTTGGSSGGRIRFRVKKA